MIRGLQKRKCFSVLFIAVLVFTYSCNFAEQQMGNTEIIEFIEEPLPIAQINKKRTKDTFPDWIKAMYNQANHTNSMDLSAAIYSVKLLEYFVMNDSIAYCVYATDNGVCLFYYLQIFNQQRKLKKKQIGESCDHDQSIESYSWVEYKILDDTVFVVKTYEKFITNNLLKSNGRIPEGEFVFNDFPSQTDSLTKTFLINNRGEIINLSNK